MKRFLLMILGAAIVSGVQAQQNNRFSVVKNNGAARQQARSHHAAVNAGTATILPRSTASKGTATPFITEDFSSGTRTTLPTGWTATNSTSSNVKWHWTNTASTGSFSVGALNSTTAANGWMIFDSDSAGAQAGYAPPLRAFLTSPSYSCTGHPNVQLTFQQYYRMYQDSCFVDVSNDGGTTWVHYDLPVNNGLASSDYLPANPYSTRINISATAGNQANVKIRFNYVTTSDDGSYNWLVDDVSLSDMDPVDVGITKSGMLYLSPESGYNSLSAYSAIPTSLVDSLFPFSFLNNYGINSLTNVAVNAKVFNGTTQVYNQTATYAALPAGASDSLVEWPATSPGYLPSAVGSYTSVFSISHTGDAFAGDNLDTFRFATTDTVFSTHGSRIAGSNFLHSPSSSSSGEDNFYFGSRFDIPAGKRDTATSISACFSSSTTPGVVVKAQIYKLDINAPEWQLVSESFSKTLTAADISTTGNPVFTTVMINTPLLGPAILEEGVYAVVFQAINAPASATVAINYSSPLYDEPGLVSFIGQSADAAADGSVSFGDGVAIATGLTTPALVRLNFGTYKALGIGNIPGVTIGNIYPNPANNQISVPVMTKETTAVTVSVSNAIGQVMAVQNMGQVAGNKTNTATFNTSGLPNGIYLITVEAKGARNVSKFVVAH